MTENRSPIVSDIDRQWALDQCPSWAVRATTATVDWLPEADPEASKPKQQNPVIWDFFVTSEIEKFERFFALERRSHADWSTLWRKSWWPKADPRRVYASRVPASGVRYPRWHRGEDGFAIALELLPPVKRRIAEQAGCVMFKPDDPIAAKIEARLTQPATLTARSRAMSGDAA